MELDLPGVKKLFLGLERKIQVMTRKRRRRSGGRRRYKRLEGRKDEIDAVFMVPAICAP